MKNILLPDMRGELRPYYLVDGKAILPFWVEIQKVD